MEIEIKNLSNFILKDINLKVKDGRIFVLLGPNGAGKTTLLNAAAGLLPHSGSVLFNGMGVDKIPIEKRNVGYLFQNLFLFPHLTVFENVSYGLKNRVKKTEIKSRVNELLNLLKIVEIKNRYPTSLSGGEKQKVAMARALAIKPEVLFLDEPFKSIDLHTARYLREELKILQRKLKITTIYVTHNLFEAEEMADRIAVMVDGRICEIGTVSEIFFESKNREVLDFIGSPNILDVSSYKVLESGLFEAECSGMNIFVPYEGEKIKKIAVLPQDVYISPFQIPGPKLNRFIGEVIDITLHLAAVRIKLRVGENVLISEVSRNIIHDFNLKIGDSVYLMLKLRWIRVIE